MELGWDGGASRMYGASLFTLRHSEPEMQRGRDGGQDPADPGALGTPINVWMLWVSNRQGAVL